MIASVLSLLNLRPAPPKTLMPLSWYGLWDAEMTTPRW
jgi:hypothetical protein